MRKKTQQEIASETEQGHQQLIDKSDGRLDMAPASNVPAFLVLLPVVIVPLFMLIIFYFTPQIRFGGVLLNESQKYVAELAILGTVFAVGVAYLLFHNRWPVLYHAFRWPLLVYLAALFLSLFQSLNPFLGLLKGLEVYLLPVLLFVFASVWNWSLRQGLIICCSALFSGLIVALIGIAQAYNIADINSFFPYAGPISLLGNKNFAAEYLIIVIPVAAAIALIWTNTFLRIVAGSVTFILLLHLVLTTARGAWVGFVVGDILALLLGAAGIYFVKRKSPHESTRRPGKILPNRTVIALFCLVPVFLLMVMTSSWWIGENDNLSIVPAEQFSKINIEHTSHRLEIWRDALDMLPDSWLAGFGPEQYMVHAPDYWGKSNRISLIKWNDNYGSLVSPRRPHNDYLQILLELGIMGLIGLVSIFSVVSWVSARGIGTSIQNGDLRRALLIKGLFSGFIAFSVSMLFEFPFRMPASMLTGWLWAALAVSFSLQGATGWKAISPVKKLLTGVVVSVLVVCCFAFAYRVLWADFYYTKADWLWNKGKQYEAFKLGNKAYAYAPWDHNIGFQLARFELFLGRYSDAQETIGDVLKKYPHSLPALWVMGRSAYYAGNNEKVLTVYGEIATKFPHLEESGKYRKLAGMQE